MKSKISKILFEELDYIYCDNCRFANEEYDYTQEGYTSSPCEDCYRKMMKWEISEQFAFKITNKILNAIKENK